MGYFSQLQINEDDLSVLCDPRVWRLEDLTGRLYHLVESGAPYHSSICLSKEDLKYSVPASLMTVCDVEQALDIQKAILRKAVHEGEYNSREMEKVFARANSLFEPEAKEMAAYEGERIAA